MTIVGLSLLWCIFRRTLQDATSGSLQVCRRRCAHGVSEGSAFSALVETNNVVDRKRPQAKRAETDPRHGTPTMAAQFEDQEQLREIRRCAGRQERQAPGRGIVYFGI